MTAYERGDVVEASDPFSGTNAARPFLVVNTDAHPFHGEQYVAVTLTTRTWYDDTLPLPDDAFVEGGVPEESSIVPWGVSSPGHADVTDRFGCVATSTVDETVEQLFAYLTEGPTSS